MKRVALATVFLGAIALTARAQPPRTSSPPSTPGAAITGRVVADDTGNPIPNARVTIAPSTTTAPVVMSDRDGRFSIVVPGSARASVSASKSGYGHRESEPIAGKTVIELRLPRAAVVTGRVVDKFGEPAAGVLVVVGSAAAAQRGTVVARSVTDDLGEYRIGSLKADAYLVSVRTAGEVERRVVGPNQVVMFPSQHEIYYPGTETASEAETLNLEPGEERPALDFVLPAGYRGMMGSFLVAGPLERDDSAPKPTGAIRGRVVSTVGRGIPRAEVRTLVSMAIPAPPGQAAPRVGLQPMTATTDDEGRYELRGLPAGSFRITASRAGYSLPGGQIFSVAALNTGMEVTLADGEVHERADITMARWGSISGRVVDELGDPLQGVSVQLLEIRYQAGRRRLVAAGGAFRPTDDLGRFRIYGFAPGQYIVSATVGEVQSADLPGYARSYYPGTPNPGEGQFVSVGLSQDITGVDFSLSRTTTALVSGTLLDASGAPSTKGSVRLISSQRSASAASVSIGARLLSEGRFEFPNVSPGQYVIQVDRGRRGSAIEGEFGALPVSVNGTDVTGLMLQTSAGSSITGNIRFDGFMGAKIPAIGAIEIVPTVIDPDQSTASPASASIRDDWSFEVSGVSGPRRLKVIRTPAEWAVREIRVRGADATDRPIAFGRSDQSVSDVEIVLTDRIATLTGTISDSHAQPAPGAHLVVFAVDRDRWYPASRYLRTATAEADGTVAVAGLPPGSYYAVAIPKLPSDGDDAWQDPAYLESLVPRASAFALGEGQRQMLALKLSER